jgi:hypothetical protein
VREALESLAPDCVLVEGPPDADELIHWLGHPALVLPVALLIYRPDVPLPDGPQLAQQRAQQRATFYPFAIFSPELQAIRFALERGSAVRFMDLPQANQLAASHKATPPPVDPFKQIATLTGDQHYEAWWNRLVEQHQRGGDALQLFAAILSLMQTVREAAEAQSPPPGNGSEPEAAGRRLALQREAYMRHCIRRAAAEGHQRIAVVCGAWHGPALARLSAENELEDAGLLDGFAAVKVEVSLVPWTYGRLAQASGYGAGIHSPGWYHHLWEAAEVGRPPVEMSASWLARVAGLLRNEDLEVSPAHVIEAVRLAEALAALRGLPFPGLAELNEATQSAICFGAHEPMDLIRRRLILGERMGILPPGVPLVPLQRDLYRQQQQLRLWPEAEKSTLTLDLREDAHLSRSHLLHRLTILEIPWGRPLPVRGQSGTYAELWELQWLPEFSARVVQASMWGNTVREAAAAFVEDTASRATELPALTGLIDPVTLADLPEAIPPLLARIEELAATSSDVSYMMETLPPLAQVLRYGGLRQTAEHKAQMRRVFDHLLARVCIGLPGACLSLDDSAAASLFERLVTVDNAVRMMQDNTQTEQWVGQWQEVLGRLADQHHIHGLLAGRACRLLHDAAVLSAGEVSTRMRRTLPRGRHDSQQTKGAADWLDGFLRNSGLILVHDAALWRLVDGWIAGLERERFEEVLPLLRRAFSTFPEAIRQQLQERVRYGGARPDERKPLARFNQEQADAVLDYVAQLLGL